MVAAITHTILFTSVDWTKLMQMVIRHPELGLVITDSLDGDWI